MNKVKELWNKVKKIKHLYVYVAIFLALIVCAIYFLQSGKKKEIDNTDKNSTENCSSVVEYANYLENKLCNVLSDLSGVENVSVAITLSGDLTYEYATDTETKTIVSGGNETTVKTQTVIMVSNEPVVLKTIFPEVKGVVVVAKGAQDVKVKLNILSAVETVLEIEQTKITILS